MIKKFHLHFNNYGMKKAINIIAIILLTANIFGQSPNAFKYQAIVRNNKGTIIANKSVEIQISILQGTVSGTAVFSEKHTSTTNQFGLVNLEIGNGILVSGGFSSINWANGPYFIKVVVNGTELGTTPLLSVPYAKYADKAGNVFSGDYNDLTNKPSMDQSWASIIGTPNFAKVATTGSYNDLSNLPAIFDGNWSSLKGVPTFAKVASTGSYTDLLNQPVIFSGIYDDLANKPTIKDWTWDLITGIPKFSIVAISGSYNDLLNKPFIFSGNYADLTNKPALFDSAWSSLKGIPIFSKVANTGSYLDLLNLPTLFSGSYADLKNLPTLFSGNYNDLSHKPAMISASWDLITGKPTFATVAVSGNYSDLLNLPVIFNGNWSSLSGKPTTLGGYGITDAMNTGNAANGITSSQIANWNTAFGWGDHSTKGYAVATFYYTKLNLQTSGGSLVHWGNITNTPTSISGYGISDFSISSPTDNQLLKYNAGNGKWENWTPNFSAGNQQLSLVGATLSISGSGGNSVSFAGWDTNSADDVTINTTQTITGDKTFSGSITVATINANNGLNANSKNITNVADPTANSDAATKAYADVLKGQITILETKISAIEKKLGL